MRLGPVRRLPRAARLGLGLAVVVFLGLQLVPIRVTNPPVRAEPPWDSPATRRLAAAACFNCHSNETKVAWFERIAPLSWFIAGHVEDGRHELNFSEYDPEDHDGGEKIADTIEDGEMPPPSYTWFGMHGEAKLSAADRAALIRGLTATYGAETGDGDGDGDSGRGRGRGRSGGD